MSESTQTSPPSTPSPKRQYPGEKEQLVLADSRSAHCILPRAYLLESAVDPQGKITLRFSLYTVTVSPDHPGRRELLPLLLEGTIGWLGSTRSAKPKCKSGMEGVSRWPEYPNGAYVAAIELTPADELGALPQLPHGSAIPTDGHFLFEDDAGRHLKVHAAHLLAFESLLTKGQTHACRFHFAKTCVSVSGPDLMNLSYAVWRREFQELHFSRRTPNVYGIGSLSINALDGSPRPFLLMNPEKWGVPAPN